MASERVKEFVASGKVTLHHCDVAAMPLADSTVDRVFHCNCYYFWPDLKKGASEIHRVMKPGRVWHCNNETDFLAYSSSKLKPVSDDLESHYLTTSFEFLSNRCLLVMLLCTNVQGTNNYLSPPRTYPGGLMVTTLRLYHVATMAAKRVMPGENWRPEAYMAALRDSGFTDVRMEDKRHKGFTFQAIYATALKWHCVHPTTPPMNLRFVWLHCCHGLPFKNCGLS